MRFLKPLSGIAAAGVLLAVLIGVPAQAGALAPAPPSPSPSPGLPSIPPGCLTGTAAVADAPSVTTTCPPRPSPSVRTSYSPSPSPSPSRVQCWAPKAATLTDAPSVMTTCWPSPSVPPTPSPTPSPTLFYACEVTYTVNQWSTGFVAALAVTNTGTRPFTPWILQVVFSGDQEVTNVWGVGDWSRTPPSVQVTNPAWKSSLAPGETYDLFGFLAASTGADPLPAGVTLNGVPCTVTRA